MEYAKSLQHCRRMQSGASVDNKDIKRISPLTFKHLIVHGTYDFIEAMTGIIMRSIKVGIFRKDKELWPNSRDLPIFTRIRAGPYF
jgi:hypothetical protein